MIAVLNDQKPFLDYRFVEFIMPLEVLQYFQVGKEKVVDAVRYLYFIDPLELTLQLCEHAAGLRYASVPKAARRVCRRVNSGCAQTVSRPRAAGAKPNLILSQHVDVIAAIRPFADFAKDIDKCDEF